MRHCKSLWETHRHRMAPDVAAIILGLIDQGQLEIVAGRIAHIEPTAQRLVVSILRRGSSGTDTPGAGWKPAHQKTVARVINCTGPDIDLRHCPDKFIASLIESGCAQPDPLGLGLKTTDGGIVLEAQGPSPMTVAIGPLRKGHLWETTAVPELREQAVEVAQIVVDAIISAANQSLNFSAPVEQMLYYGVPTNGVANGSC